MVAVSVPRALRQRESDLSMQIVGRDPGVHDKLVLIDQSQLHQRQRELHASREQSMAGFLLERMDTFRQPDNQ